MRFNVVVAAISAKLPGAHRATDAPPVLRKVGNPMSGTTWEEDEIFALAGFCHDEADILRPVLSAAQLQCVLENREAKDFGKSQF